MSRYLQSTCSDFKITNKVNKFNILYTSSSQDLPCWISHIIDRGSDRRGSCWLCWMACSQNSWLSMLSHIITKQKKRLTVSTNAILHSKTCISKHTGFTFNDWLQIRAWNKQNVLKFMKTLNDFNHWIISTEHNCF